MCFSNEACDQLLWWTENIFTASSSLNHCEPSVIIATDSASLGWGVLNVCTNKEPGGQLTQ